MRHDQDFVLSNVKPPIRQAYRNRSPAAPNEPSPSAQAPARSPSAPQQLPRRKPRLEQRGRIHKRRLLTTPHGSLRYSEDRATTTPRSASASIARSTFATGSPRFDPSPIPARTVSPTILAPSRTPPHRHRRRRPLKQLRLGNRHPRHVDPPVAHQRRRYLFSQSLEQCIRPLFARSPPRAHAPPHSPSYRSTRRSHAHCEKSTRQLLRQPQIAADARALPGAHHAARTHVSPEPQRRRSRRMRRRIARRLSRPRDVAVAGTPASRGARRAGAGSGVAVFPHGWGNAGVPATAMSRGRDSRPRHAHEEGPQPAGRLPRTIASATATTSTISATSCTRTMSTFAAAASATVAAVPNARSSTGFPVSRPIVDLRDVPSSVGKPSATRRSERAQQREVVLGRLSEADPRIEDHVLGADAGAHAAFGCARRARPAPRRRRRARRSRRACCA